MVDVIFSSIQVKKENKKLVEKLVATLGVERMRSLVQKIVEKLKKFDVQLSSSILLLLKDKSDGSTKRKIEERKKPEKFKKKK